jgi:hypothetical protein
MCKHKKILYNKYPQGGFQGMDQWDAHFSYILSGMVAIALPIVSLPKMFRHRIIMWGHPIYLQLGATKRGPWCF